jgi:hypothetical protein
MDNKIVLCKDVRAGHLLEEFGVKPEKVSRVLEEARYLCEAAGYVQNAVAPHVLAT